MEVYIMVCSEFMVSLTSLKKTTLWLVKGVSWVVGSGIGGDLLHQVKDFKHLKVIMNS